MNADKAHPLDADDSLGAALATCIEAIDRGDSDPHFILACYLKGKEEPPKKE